MLYETMQITHEKKQKNVFWHPTHGVSLSFRFVFFMQQKLLHYLPISYFTNSQTQQANQTQKNANEFMRTLESEWNEVA